MPDKETIPAIRKEMDVEMLLEIKQVLSFKETNVELAHRQQLIKFLFELYHHLSPLLEEKERRIKELKETNEYLKSDNLKVYKENEQLQQQVKELEGLLLDIDKSLYLGEDLKDKEILDWYIEVTKTIKESIKEQKFNPQPSDIKTAEDVLDKYYQSGMHWKVVNRSRVLQAMKEYASQFRAVPDEAPYRVLLGGLDITKSCKIDG